MSKNRFLRRDRRQGAEPGLAPELVPRTEHEETRRAARDWLRERDDENAIDWPDEQREFG